MHEVSIVNSILRTLELEFSEEKLTRLRTIHLRVGILANIEPRLLYNAFDAVNQSDSRYQNVQLHIDSIGIKIKCTVCDHISEVVGYRFLCAHCGRPSKNLIQGEELLIHKVEFED